jgi:dienelactone hydrolase
MNGSTIDVPTPDGVADCYLTKPAGDGAHPGVLFMIDAIGLRPRIEEMADRIAAQGYVVLAPNVFYRAGRAPLWETPDLHDVITITFLYDTMTTSKPSASVVHTSTPVTDTVTVSGNGTDVPTGNISFKVCGPLTGPSGCTSAAGTTVGLAGVSETEQRRR